MKCGVVAGHLIRNVVLLSTSVAGFGSQARVADHIPSATRSTLKCIYDLVRSDRSVQSVGAYDIDGFRFAVEYTFRDVDRQAVSDIVLTEAEKDTFTYEGTLLEDEWTDVIRSKCHVQPAFDNLWPRPKPRAEWRPIKLAR